MAFPQSTPSYSTLASSSVTRNGVVTHPHLHVRDAHDAHIVLEAVRQNILPIIKRRLLSSEREELKSGHVYVWEEAQDEGGLLRWTDGRRWSQSRMRGDYLFYEEKVETTQEERDAKAARRARRASDPSAVLPVPTRRKDRPSKPDGLTKQTYSVAVHLPGSSESRKWHVVAYFSVKGNRLFTLAPRAYADIMKGNDTWRFHKQQSPECADRSQNKLPLYDYSGSPRIPISPTSSPTTSSMAVSPHRQHNSLPTSFSRETVLLPPITSLGSATCMPSLHQPHRSSTGGSAKYTPLSSEDRRVLDSFRIVL